ncbi:MAG: hypothetical protein V3V72_08745, partial [Ignavibacteriaceae bacterium]
MKNNILVILVLSLSWVCCSSILAQGEEEPLWEESEDNIYNTNSGNVGIGTETPSSKLTIFGSQWNGGLELYNTT